MKPVIGIITRYDKNKTDREVALIYKTIIDSIYLLDCIPLGIIPKNETIDNIENLYNIIDLCDGIILQGGSDILYSDIKLVKYIHKKDIPVLGICLGMQTMNVALGGILSDLNNNSHLSSNNYVHEIKIIKNTKFYNIVKKDNLKVNSRHISYIKKTPLIISAYNDVIEVTEDPTKRFFMGLQYHIEDMITYDKEEYKIFLYFINICKEYMYELKKN